MREIIHFLQNNILIRFTRIDCARARGINFSGDNIFAYLTIRLETIDINKIRKNRIYMRELLARVSFYA